MSPEIDVHIAAAQWAKVDALDALTRRCIEISLEECAMSLAHDCEVSVVFSDNTEIQQLNAQWRGLNKPTNVLSFPTPGDLAQKKLLGDIIIAYETVAQEAADQKKSINAHVAHMVMHGFLHLLGYDHECDADAQEMELMERRIAMKMGIKDPYASMDDEPNAMRITPSHLT